MVLLVKTEFISCWNSYLVHIQHLTCFVLRPSFWFLITLILIWERSLLSMILWFPPPCMYSLISGVSCLFFNFAVRISKLLCFLFLAWNYLQNCTLGCASYEWMSNESFLIDYALLHYMFRERLLWNDELSWMDVWFRCIIACWAQIFVCFWWLRCYCRLCALV